MSDTCLDKRSTVPPSGTMYVPRAGEIASVVFFCLTLVACAPLKLYEGKDLPAEETAVIHPGNAYGIVAVDGNALEQPTYRRVAVRPGSHQVNAFHSYRQNCVPADPFAALLLLPLVVDCFASSDDTNCAALVSDATTGHDYKISAGDDDTVLIVDDTDDTVVARATKTYRGDEEGWRAFVKACAERVLSTK